MFNGNTTIGKTYLEKLRNKSRVLPGLLVASRRAYIDMLRIQDNSVRWQLQGAMSNLRDAIAEATDSSSQEVQETHEALAWEPEIVVNEKLEKEPFQL